MRTSAKTADNGNHKALRAAPKQGTIAGELYRIFTENPGAIINITPSIALFSEGKKKTKNSRISHVINSHLAPTYDLVIKKVPGRNNWALVATLDRGNYIEHFKPVWGVSHAKFITDLGYTKDLVRDLW